MNGILMSHPIVHNKKMMSATSVTVFFFFYPFCVIIKLNYTIDKQVVIAGSLY